MESSRRAIVTTLIALVLVGMSQQKFGVDYDWNTITEDALLKDPYIEVEGTSKHFNIDEYELTHLKFVEVGKNKRKTY